MKWWLDRETTAKIIGTGLETAGRTTYEEMKTEKNRKESEGSLRRLIELLLVLILTFRWAIWYQS